MNFLYYQFSVKNYFDIQIRFIKTEALFFNVIFIFLYLFCIVNIKLWKILDFLFYFYFFIFFYKYRDYLILQRAYLYFIINYFI